MKIKLLGVPYEVEMTNQLLECAQINYMEQRILLSDRHKKKEELQASLIHEIIECINFKCDLGLSHQTISTIEVGIHAVFRRYDLP